jgi:phosphatidylinositol-4,5-bisphosphate 3-kinase
MPELSQYSDIDYLKKQLSLDLSELEATNKFINEIHNSLNSTFRRIDNLFHALKRG